MIKLYSTISLILLLLSTTLFYKFQATHYRNQLDAIKIKYEQMQNAIKVVEKINQKETDKEKKYIASIRESKLDNNCDGLLKFIEAEMKKND